MEAGGKHRCIKITKPVNSFTDTFSQWWSTGKMLFWPQGIFFLVQYHKWPQGKNWKQGWAAFLGARGPEGLGERTNQECINAKFEVLGVAAVFYVVVLSSEQRLRFWSLYRHNGTKPDSLTLMTRLREAAHNHCAKLLFIKKKLKCAPPSREFKEMQFNALISGVFLNVGWSPS